MATREQLRTMTTAQPFRPFVIRLADGQSFEVNHPEFVACSPNGRELVVYGDDGAMHLLEVLLVAEMARIPAQSTKPDGNGT
jgi:hypothetical protein